VWRAIAFDMVENRFIGFKTRRDYYDIRSDLLHKRGQFLLPVP